MPPQLRPARREETADVRSLANTVKLFANNPTQRRLRELEVLEKVVASSKLNIVLGDKGLTDREINVLSRKSSRSSTRSGPRVFSRLFRKAVRAQRRCVT
jgi:hypothetical protein